MKASTLTSEANLVVKEKIGLRSGWKHLFQKLGKFFKGSFESDWEKKTGLPWHEWGKFPKIQ